MELYSHRLIRFSARPRNGRVLDAMNQGQQAVISTGGGSSTPQYWELATVAPDGTPLEESKYYLRPLIGKHVVVPGDVVAFADGGEYASGLPVADFDTFGLFKAKRDGGLLFSDTEGWYIDPNFIGGGGIDEKQLEEYLTKNQYVNVEYLTKNGYLTLKSTLTGYSIADRYEPLSPTDTILSAIGKLEKNFGNYVDLTTNQTIGGVKTFNENVLSKKDVIAFADGGSYASGLPVADTVTYGLVKIDGTTIRVNADGQLEADAGGGIDFTVGAGLQLSTSSVLSVKFGTTADMACRGNDSRLSDDRPNPYYLSWSGYSNGSYDGSEEKSFEIPNNTSQLINGAGFIKDGNGNFTTLQGSGNNSQYLAGNGRFYTITHNEIEGLDSNYVKKSGDTMTGDLTIRKSTPSLFLSGSRTWQIYESGGDLGFKNNNAVAGYFSGANNGNFVINGTMLAKKDIVAFADGGSYASGLPVADQYTYGLTKYDNLTIKKNSNGQLYAVNSGGGGTVNVIDNLNSSSATDALSANQGRVLDSRLKNIRWGTPDGTDYVRTYLGSEYRDLSKNGHSHSIYLQRSDMSDLTIYVDGVNRGTYNPVTGDKSIYINTGSGGGAASELTSYVTTPYSGTVFKRSGNNIGIKVSGGNSLNGYDSNGPSDIGNLYLNYVSGSINVRISNEGKIYSNGSQVTSDLRLKRIVGHEENVLDRMLRIPVIRYFRTDIAGDVETTGFGAQNFIGVFDNVTFTNPDSGYYGIQEGAILGIAFQGVKELYNRFKPVENKVKVLENKVQNLQLRLDNAYREIFELKAKKGGAA